MDNFDPLAAAKARRNRFYQFLLGLSVFAIIGTIVWLLGKGGREITFHEILCLAVPGAYALASLVEFVTEVPFTELARRWDSLRGWQRGVFGTFIVAVATLIIVAAIGLSAS